MNADNNNVADASPRRGMILMMALLALVASGKAVLYDTLDPDCFWHLRVAEQLQHDGVGPLVDRISFASIKTPWTPYSWLAELGMKAVWDIGGFRAALLIQAISMAGLVILLAACAMQLVADPEANPLAVIIATAFAMYWSLPYLSFRPVTFAIVLLALCAWLILRDRRLGETTRAIWWILPLTAFITNVHFFAILVPAWIAALLIGAVVEKRRVKRYAVIFLASTLACLATPMLPGAIRAVWNYQFADPMLGSGMVAEFQPFWAGPLGLISAALVAALFAFSFYYRERIRVGEKIWLLGSVLLLIRLGRFAPIFAPIAAAILAACLPCPGKAVLSRKASAGAVVCVLIVGVFRIGFAFPRSAASLNEWLNRHGPETPGYPCAAADFVAANIQPQSKKLINEFSWGGYLAWRLGDQYQILLDGRTQVYTPAFWRQMYLVEHSNDAAAVLRSCNADVAILPLHRSRFRPILIEAGWSIVYRDDRAEVLLPPNRIATHASVE